MAASVNKGAVAFTRLSFTQGICLKPFGVASALADAEEKICMRPRQRLLQNAVVP